MRNFDDVNYFTDPSLISDPQPYFDYLRNKGPGVRLAQQGAVAVTSYETGLAIFRDEEHYSSVNSTGGLTPLPFKPEGDDISSQIEQHRDELPAGALISSLDPPRHTQIRSLLMGMITPRRLKENEDFMWSLADQLIDEFIGQGSFEVLSAYGQPFATLVIADLLGVPEDDHKQFRELKGPPPGSIDGSSAEMSNNPLAHIGSFFFAYIEDRRREPRKDILTELAHAKLPDGGLPSVIDLVMLATFLFAAGQETTVRVIGAMLRFVAEDAELQRRLRADRSLIPNFVEETLRLESAVKTDFRLAKVRTKIGEVELNPGTPVVMHIGAMNRDPHRFDSPHSLRLDRKNVRDHLAFGRGIHACAGAPLARAELRITLERLFDRTQDIRLSERQHGPVGGRRFGYVPSFIMRGLKELHLEFTPSAQPVTRRG
jgi:cytochrome P450